MDLSVEGVFVRYGELEALAGVTLQLGAGERALLLGPAGSGKTTLLKVLAGLLPPDQGVVRWDGRDAYRLPAGERKQRQAALGMVFQADALFDSLNVLENVLLPLVRRGLPRPQALPRAWQALEAVGLAEAAERWPEQLSGGMRKRAGLARALVAGPQVLLADDPLAGLDPAIGVQVAELLWRSSEGRTLLAAAPDPIPRLPLPRWIALEVGRVRYDGPAPPAGAFPGGIG